MADFEKVYKISFETTSAIGALRKVDTYVKKIGESVKRVGKAFDKYIGRDAQHAADRLHHLTEKLEKSVENLSKNLRHVGTAAKQTGRDVQKGIDGKAVVAMRKLNAVTKKTRRSLQKTGDALVGIGRKLSYMSAAFAAFGGLSIRSSLELNKAMANVSTLLSTGANDVFTLKTAVQDMSVETGKSTSDLAEGLYEVISAFGDTTDATNQLKVATSAGVAGRASTLESIKMLSAVTKGYGDTSSEALQNVSDLAFKTVELGQTTFPELAASMGRVVPLAAAVNTSQTDLFATMATLTGVTGTAAEVSTQLASVYASFLKPTEAMNKLVKKQGFASATAMLKAKGLAGMMDLLKEKTGGEADEVAKFIRRKEGQIAVLALTGGQADIYSEKVKKMGDAVGATDAAYKKQTEGINAQGHAWEKTRRRMERFMVKLGDRLLPLLDRLLDVIEPVVKALEDMTDAEMESAAQWVVFLAALGPVVTILGKAVAFAGTLKSIFVALGPVLGVFGKVAGVAAPLLAKVGTAIVGMKTALVAWGAWFGTAAAALSAAVAAIAVAVYATYRYWDTLKTAMEGSFHALEAAFWHVINGVERGLNKMIGLAAKIPVIGGFFEDKQVDTSGSAESRDRAARLAVGRGGDIGGALERDYARTHGGDVSPEKQAQNRNLASLKGQVNQAQNIAQYGGGGGGEWQMNSQSAGGGGSNTTNNVNMVVNSSKADARDVAKEVDKRLRKETQKLDRGGKSLVAGES